MLEEALRAGTIEAAVEPMRLGLEVLSRDDVIRVAMAIAVESASVLTPTKERPRFSERLGQRRLGAMAGEL